jgi:UDP-GlcNAc:undecaprenyl-phosphate GlcNAc-1-phosphate transferase
MQLLLLLVAALTVTVALMPALVRIAPRVGLMDVPGGRKAHSLPTPRVGGVALVVGTLTSLLLMGEQSAAWMHVYAGGLLLLGIGLWDDCVNLRWPFKLAAQFLACTIAVVYGDVRIDSLSLVERIDIPVQLAIPLSILFMVGVTNAINMTDGLDGLAGGTNLLVVLVIGWFAYQSGDVAVATTTAALAGGLLGFLRFNTHPARVFMGDSGSQFLGYMVAVVAIQSTQGAETAISAALPLLLLAWPIIDTMNVIVERLLAGQSPFVADRRHLHHQLLQLGLDHYQSVILIYALHAVLFVAAYLLRFESDVVILAAFLGVMLALLGPLHLARRVGWQLQRSAGDVSAIAKRLEWIRDPRRLPLWTPRILALLVCAYPLLIDYRELVIAPDIRLLILGIAVLQGFFVFASGSWQVSSFRRLPSYLAAAVLVYLDYASVAPNADDSLWTMILFGAIACAILVQFRLSSGRRGTFTPLDALVLLVAILTPLFAAHELVDSASVALGVFKVVLLLYALEFLGARPALERTVGAGVLLVCSALLLLAG